jgi:hypothetical protein
MKLLISEEEKKRILLLYEQEVSQFVKDIARKLNTTEDGFAALDWSLYLKPEEESTKNSLSKMFPQVKEKFSSFTTDAFNNKTDLSDTITYFKNYNNSNITKEQRQWLNSATNTLVKLKQAIDNPTTTTTTTAATT